MEKNNKLNLEINKVSDNNQKIDKKVVDNVNKLREQARNFGHIRHSSYRLSPPLGDQLLFSRR